MKLERIIGLANQNSEIEFRVMERSLRATGCQLPIDVIPYDQNLFELPPSSRWWYEPVEWVTSHFASQLKHPFQYRVFLVACTNFQVADSDLVFLKDPEKTLQPFDGLVTACHQWSLPHLTASEKTLQYLQSNSSTWHARVFNAGQYAVGGPVLYQLDELLEILKLHEHATHTFDDNPPWDQGGLNYLLSLKKPAQVNLTLPPYSMQSTWAGDYPGEYAKFWKSEDSKPYLIHWAGSRLDEDRPINELFFEFLTNEEKRLWKQKQAERLAKQHEQFLKNLGFAGRCVHDVKQLTKRFLPGLANRLRRSANED